MTTVSVLHQSDELRVAIIVATNPGGVGKTTTVGMVEAAATFANLKVAIIDADASSHGLSIETNDPRIVKLINILRSSEADISGFVSDLCNSGAQVVLVDGGAAITAADALITNGFRDLCDSLKVAGYRIISLLPVGTSKGQSEKPLEVLAERLQRLGDVSIAATDSLGSRQWPNWVQSKQLPVITVPRLAPGFVDLRKRFPMPLSDFLWTHNVELRECQAAFAGACLQLIATPAFATVASTWNLDPLRQLSQRQSVHSVEPATAADAVTSVMLSTSAYRRELNALFAAARDNPSHPAYPAVSCRANLSSARYAAKKSTLNPTTQS